MHVDGDAAGLPAPPPFASPSPALTETMTLPAGTLYIPMNQGTKHWIQAVLGENPFLPFPYFYDQVTWSYSLLRGFSGDGFLTQQLPSGTSMSLVFDPMRDDAGHRGIAGVRVQHGLDGRPRDGEPAAEPGGERLPRPPRRSTPAACTSRPARRSSTARRSALATLNADSAQWATPVYGLSSYPVSRYALRLPKIGIYTGGTTAPTNPTFNGAGDGQCSSTGYCEAMYDLSVKEQIPVSQIGQITSTDLAAGVLVSQGYTAFVNPGSTIAAGAGATALQAFVNAGGIYIGSVANGTTSARNAGITLLNTASDQRAQHPRLDVRRRLLDGHPGGLGLRHGRLDLPLGERRPDLQPGDDGRQRDDDPGPDRGRHVRAVRRLRRPGLRRLGDRPRLQQLLRLRGQRERHAPGRQHEPSASRPAGGRRPAVRRGPRDPDRVRPVVPRVDDQEERLVLNGVLYPAGSAIPPSSALRRAGADRARMRRARWLGSRRRSCRRSRTGRCVPPARRS